MGNTRKTLSFENGEFIASKLKTFDAQLKDAMDAKDAILHNTITEEIHEKVTTEANERVKQDNVLHSYIDAETKLLQEKDALLSKEIASFHDELIAEIGFRQAADTELDGKISNETSAREAADTELEEKISAETSARENADTELDGKISAETSARENADTELDEKIGSLEDINDNLSKDNIVAAINSLDQKINNSVENIINGEENGKIDSLKEIIDWITSDNDVEGVVAFKNHVNELDGKISDEASAREAGDTELDGKIGSLNDLEDDLSKDNIVAAINSLNTTVINNYTEITNITNNIYEILNGNEDGSEKGLIEKVSDHNSRLDSVDENITELGSRLDSVEDSVSDLDSRLGSVEERVPDSLVSKSDYDALDERVNALEEQIQNLVNTFVQFEELKPTE